MSASTVQILAQAHEYIEAGNLEDAENLIRSLLEQEPDNTDAWWLLAHSVRDPDAAREALDQVLRRDPNDQQALSLLAALDDRFPGEEGGGEGRRLSLPKPRLPSVSLPGGNGYRRPLGALVLVVLVVIAGWLALRFAGVELRPGAPTPAVIPAEPTQVVVVEGEDTPVAGTEVPATVVPEATEDSATAAPETGEGIPGAVATPGEEATIEIVSAGAGESQAAATDSGPQPGRSDISLVVVTARPGATAAPVGGAEARVPVEATATAAQESATAVGVGAEGDEGEAGVSAPATEAVETVVPAVAPVPTYPFPVQTEAEEFNQQFRDSFQRAELVLARDTLQLEGSSIGSTALAVVCLDAARGLRETLNAAMQVMAGHAAGLRNSAPALGARIVDCERENAVQLVIAAPLEDAAAWSAGTLELAVYQASWEAVG